MHTLKCREEQRRSEIDSERYQQTQQKLKINSTYRDHKETANSGLIETMVSDNNLFTILMYFLWVFMPWLYPLQLMICVCICAASDSICVCVEAWIEINANSRRLSNFDLILFFSYIFNSMCCLSSTTVLKTYSLSHFKVKTLYMQ